MSKNKLILIIAILIVVITSGIGFAVYQFNQPKPTTVLIVNTPNKELEKAIAENIKDQTPDEIDMEKSRNSFKTNVTLFGYDNKYAYAHVYLSGTLHYTNSNIPSLQFSETYKQESPYPVISRFTYKIENGQYKITDEFSTTEYMGEPSIENNYPKEIVDAIKKDGRFSFPK